MSTRHLMPLRPARHGATKFATGLAVLSVAISGLITAPPATATGLVPSQEAGSPAPAADPISPVDESALETLSTPTPALPEDDGFDNTEQVDPSTSPSEPAVPAPAPSDPAPAEPAPTPSTPAPPSNPGPQDPSALEKEVEVPVEEMSEEQLLELLAALQGKHGAEMGQGLQQRDERLEELQEPEAKEELEEQLEVLDIERTGSMQPAAAPAVLPADKRDMWRPKGVQGIDVSSHQPSVNWQTEWNYGARFAYVKSTEALNYMNPRWTSQYTGSYQVGMIRGSYHFAIPNVSSGKRQANYFVDNGGGWSADGKTLPPLLDIEYNPYPELGNTCYSMSASKMVALD